MPRDYANNSSNKKAPLPGWMWLLGGLFIGFFVAFLWYLNQTSSGKQKDLITSAVKRTLEDARGVHQTKPETPPGPTDRPAEEKKRPRFDFYTILPEQEVAIPEQDLRPGSKPATTGSTPSTTTTPGNYMLQAGSFRKEDEADKLRAKLALVGVVASIQPVSINSGDTWYRVRIGPITDLDKLNRTRQRLHDNGITALVVKDKHP